MIFTFIKAVYMQYSIRIIDLNYLHNIMVDIWKKMICLIFISNEIQK